MVVQGWLRCRVRLHGYRISRYPADVARYKMVKHAQESTNPVNKCRYSLMYKVNRRWARDGLNSLRYARLERQLRPLFTLLRVDLLERESRERLLGERICK